MYEEEIREKEERVRQLKQMIKKAETHNVILLKILKRCDENE